MPARILSGTEIANTMRAELVPQIEKLKNECIQPGLATVLVGEDPASQMYVRMKGRACEKAGMYSKTLELPAETSETELLELVDGLNSDEKIHGILVQFPLPDHIDSGKLIQRMLPAKDVDGFHPENVGKVALGDPTGFRPCTPYGIQQMLLRSDVEIEGAHVVIVG